MPTLKVLIADDDRLTRMILERSVVQWGYHYISAADGEAACELLKNQRVDVCILDWEMPGLTGPEVCKWIKSTENDRTPHVILNTTKDRPEDIQAAYEAGANLYLTKPTDMRHLRRQLARLAANAQQQVAARTSESTQTGALGLFPLFSQQ